MQSFFIQAIGFIPSMIAITSLQSSSRKKILMLQFVCNVMWLSHYVLLGAGTLAVTNVIGLLRALLCYYNDRPWVNHRWVPVMLGAMYIAGAAFTFQGAVSILPCIAMLMTTVALWSHNMRLTRMLFLLNSPCMLLANLLARSYSCALIECAALLSFAIAVYRYDIRENETAMETELLQQ